MKKIISIAVSLAIIFTIFSGCSKEEVYRLVKVKSFEGAVTVERKEKMDAFEGLQLISEDSVEVGTASLLELLADSDKHIIAEENTAFRLHSTGTEASGNITIDLLCGKSLFTIDNKLPDGSTFEVNTPNVALSVRGTSYSVEYSPDTEESHVTVFEGQVDAKWEGGGRLIGKGGEIAVSGSGDNITVNIISEGELTPAPIDDGQPRPAGSLPAPGGAFDPEVGVEGLEYIDETAFEIRYSGSKEYSGVKAKALLSWTTAMKPADDDRPDEFLDKGVRIRYWALTKAEADREIEEVTESGRVNSLNYLTNGDGEKIVSLDFKPDNTGGIKTLYQYFKEVSEDLHLSVTVCVDEQRQSLEGTDLSTFLTLTENKYFIFSTEGASSAVIGSLIDDEDWSDLLKGGANYDELIYLLEIASRCEYWNKKDCLEDALYLMCCETYKKLPYTVIDTLEDGSAVYDVAELNRLFSFLTNDTIDKENLNPGINRLDGDRLICTADLLSAEKTTSTGIYSSCYGEAGEIIIDYQFNVVDNESLDVECFTKKAHLDPDETGKYVLSYLE